MVKKIFVIVFIGFLSQEAMAGGHDEGGGGAKIEVPSTLNLADIVIPVIVREEVRAYYSINLTLEPKDESKKETLAQFGPRIRDAIIHELYLILPIVWNKDSNPDITGIKKRLEKAAKKAVPEDTIGLFTVNTFQLNDKS